MKSAVFSYAHLGVDQTLFDPYRKFVSSPVLSPVLLAAIRTLLALYALSTICTVLAFDVAMGDGKSFLSYFTELSYIGLTAYYCAAAVQTLFYARYGTYPLQRWPRPLQALHVLLQSTVISFPFIVTVVFWALLSSAKTFSTTYDAWSNISLHALNSAFALFELLFTNAPPAPWLALPLHVLLFGGYLGVAYITYATQGFYTYSFLDPQTEHAFVAAYIAGIALGAVIVFLLGRGVAAVRQRLVGRRGHYNGSASGVEGGFKEGEGVGVGNEKGLGGKGGRGRSAAADPEAMNEWEEVAAPTTAPNAAGAEAV